MKGMCVSVRRDQLEGCSVGCNQVSETDAVVVKIIDLWHEESDSLILSCRVTECFLDLIASTQYVQNKRSGGTHRRESRQFHQLPRLRIHSCNDLVQSPEEYRVLVGLQTPCLQSGIEE